MEKMAYSLDEVCKLTGLSKFLLHKQLKAGKLVDSRIGGRRLVMREEIKRWLEEAKSNKLEPTK